MTDDVIDIIFEGVSEAPDPHIIRDSSIYLECLGGKVLEIPEESGALSFRQAE